MAVGCHRIRDGRRTLFDADLWPSALDCFDSSLHLRQLRSGEKDRSARFTSWSDAGDRNTPCACTSLSVVFRLHRPGCFPPHRRGFGCAACGHRTGDGGSPANVCLGSTPYPALSAWSFCRTSRRLYNSCLAYWSTGSRLHTHSLSALEVYGQG